MNQKQLEQLVHDLAMAEVAAAKQLADEEQASRERLEALAAKLGQQSEEALAALEREMAMIRGEQVREAEATVETLLAKTDADILAMSKKHERALAKLVDWAITEITRR